MIKTVFKWFGITMGVAVLGLLFVVWLKVVFYEQADDEKHRALKVEYLAEVARTQRADDSQRRPNIVLIVFDDLGLGDVGVFSRSTLATPNMNAIAEGGAQLTQYYAPAPVCTPSRAAMLTGRYAPRAGLPQVVFPEGHFLSNYQKVRGMNVRLPSEEITIADVLKSAGYRTGMVGKWHLGDNSPSLPNDMGFEYFFGAHYSNDMPDFSLFRNQEPVDESPIDQRTLTSRYTAEAVAFIDRHQDEPFFLYVPHNFPHVPLFTSQEQQGKSMGGLYGDVVEDLDNSVGAIVDTLSKLDLAENTLLIITSDNGPWWQGSPGGARGRKADIFEGAMRVPFIARWPAKIAGRQVIDDMASGIDLFPTILDFIGIPLPTDRAVDGRSMKSLLLENGPSAQKQLYYYSGDELFAVRTKRFKYHIRRPLAHTVAWQLPFNVAMSQGPWLFDLKNDKDESYDVSAKYPKEFEDLAELLEQRNLEMLENPRGWVD